MPGGLHARLLVFHDVVLLSADGGGGGRDDEASSVVRRCYCNDASCVKTGYMCKTTLGACFAHRRRSRDRQVRYACADRLDDHADRRLCLTSAAAVV